MNPYKQLTEINEMNLIYQLAFLFPVIVSLYQVVNVFGIHLKNRSRYKRVFNGNELSDNQFSYVVFLKYLDHSKSSIDPCNEKVCTGTLIHRRFVLTLSKCLPKSNVKTIPVRVYLRIRPYDLEDKNLTYNSGEQIINKPYIDFEPSTYVDKVALVLMNATFPEITTYPKILNFNPIPVEIALSCTTVGFGLVGRNLPQPIVESLSPMTYDLEVHLNFEKCSPKKGNIVNAYLCYTGLTPLNRSLCQMGDEGAPLLCKRHDDAQSKRGAAKRQNDGDAANDDGDEAEDDGDESDDGMYLYGVAEIMPRCDNVVEMNNILFIYLLPFGAWINSVLAEFDEEEQLENMTTEAAPNFTSTTQTALTSSRMTTITVLPAYYDTDDYDAVQKKPMRCKGRDRLVRRHVAGSPSSYAAAAATDRGSQNVFATFASAVVLLLIVR